MVIQFLGSGSEFEKMTRNYHSTVFITENKKSMLIDVSYQIPEILREYKINISDIDKILLTHNHGVNVLGLEYIGKYIYLNKCNKRPELISYNLILVELWENILKGLLRNVNGSIMKFTDYFDLKPLPPRGTFNFESIKISLVQVPHVITPEREIYSFGYKFEYNNIKIFITGDCRFDYWRLIGFYETCDIIFHDCLFGTKKSEEHTHYDELKQLPIEYRKKIYLYNYEIENNISLSYLKKQVLEDGFKGIVLKGQKFKFGEKNINE